MNLKNIFSLFCSALLLTVFMCEDDSNPSGPGSNNITQEEIIGQWYVVQETEASDFTEDGVRYNESETNTFTLDNTGEVMVFAPEVITFYNHNSEHQSCYDVSTSEYSISGNSVLGEDFNLEETENGEKYTINTKIWMNGKQLNIDWTESITGESKNGWGKNIFVLEKYTGNIPPAHWPSTKCLSKKANHVNGFKRHIQK